MPVGRIDDKAEKLIRDTEKCFWLGADQARAGNRLGDISHAVQAYAEAQGYGVIRDLCGHGIGEEMHEDPSIPNFGRPGRGVRLQPGMTLAIEPMICMATGTCISTTTTGRLPRATEASVRTMSIPCW